MKRCSMRLFKFSESSTYRINFNMFDNTIAQIQRDARIFNEKKSEIKIDKESFH